MLFCWRKHILLTARKMEKLKRCPTCGKWNREPTHEEMIAMFKGEAKKAAKNKKTAIAYLAKAGIVNKKGILKKEYGGTA